MLRVVAAASGDVVLEDTFVDTWAKGQRLVGGDAAGGAALATLTLGTFKKKDRTDGFRWGVGRDWSRGRGRDGGRWRRGKSGGRDGGGGCWAVA